MRTYTNKRYSSPSATLTLVQVQTIWSAHCNLPSQNVWDYVDRSYVALILRTWRTLGYQIICEVI